MIDPNLFYVGLLPGMLGGVMLHVYWMLSVFYSGNPVPDVAKPSRTNFRLGLLCLSAAMGASAGFLVFTWFFVEINAGTKSIPHASVQSVLVGLFGVSHLRSMINTYPNPVPKY
jgi:hypothetical protein